MVQRLTRDGVAFERPNTYGAGTGVTYDPEALKILWEGLAAEAGVELLLHTWATGVRVRDGRVEAVRTWNKGGERWFEAGAFVDASGDADVAAMAGAGYDDAKTTPATQALSTLFKLANVDLARASKVPKSELWARMREAAASGRYDLPRLEGSWHRTPHPGVVMVHMTRVPNVDATDPVALTRAEVQGRRQVREYHRFLRDCVPGFEEAVLVSTSPAIGVRESRRVIGDYRLTREDVLAGRRFADEIALCGAPIEDHGAGGHDVGLRARRRRLRDPVPDAPARGSRRPAGRRPLLLGDPRRPRVGPIDGHVHGDGPGGRHRRGLAIQGATTPRAVPTADLRARLLVDGALLSIPSMPRDCRR